MRIGGRTAPAVAGRAAERTGMNTVRIFIEYRTTGHPGSANAKGLWTRSIIAGRHLLLDLEDEILDSCFRYLTPNSMYKLYETILEGFIIPTLLGIGISCKSF